MPKIPIHYKRITKNNYQNYLVCKSVHLLCIQVSGQFSATILADDTHTVCCCCFQSPTHNLHF